MYYVGCFRPNGSEILGSGSGQGFYNYKRIRSVVKILSEYHIGKHEKYHNVSHITFKIWEITEAEKFKDFENYKKPVLVL